MKQKRQFLGFAVAVAIISGGIFLHSCKKETGIIPTLSTSYAKNYIGTYVGTSSCHGDSVTMVVNAGADKTKAYFNTFFGLSGCKIVTTMQATIKGDSLIIPFQEYRDKCFDDYSVTGGAIFRNDSMFLSVTTVYEDSTITCGFYGRKLVDDNGIHTTE